MKQLDIIRSMLINELQISKEEVEVFLVLLKEEKYSAELLQSKIKRPLKDVIENMKELEKKGMIIEVNNNVFRSLHPRFAVVNRYRKLCGITNVPFKKNLKIDNLAIMVEKYQSDQSEEIM